MRLAVSSVFAIYSGYLNFLQKNPYEKIARDRETTRWRGARWFRKSDL